MPNCVVPGCKGSGAHLFPKDETLKKKWEEAICRENYVAKKHSRLCRNHFHESDYVGESAYTGNPQICKYLKKGTVPSIFSWTTWVTGTPTSTNESSVDQEEFQEASANQEKFEVCRVCLALDVKMFDMKNFKLSEMFENITGILDSDDKEIKTYHICWECAARLKAAAAFRDKALLSDTMLKDVVHVTKSDIVNLKDTHISLKSQLTVHTTSTYIECEYSESEINNETDVKEESNIRVNEEEKETEYQENEPCIDISFKIKMEYDPIAENDDNSNERQDYDDEITNINTKTNNEMANVQINHTSLVDDIERKPSLDEQIRIDFESLIKKAKHNTAIEAIVDESPKKKYKMTNRIKEKILEMKSNGAPTRTIADETGLSVSSIDCWWSRYHKSCPIYQKNLKIKRNQQNTEHNYQYKPEPNKDMEECSPIVRQRLHEAGLEHILMKKPEKNPSTLPMVSDRKSLHDDLKKRIKALKEEGIINTRIAYLLNTSPKTVRKWWSRWCEEGHMQNQPKGTGRKRKNSRSRSALETEGDADQTVHLGE